MQTTHFRRAKERGIQQTDLLRWRLTGAYIKAAVYRGVKRWAAPVDDPELLDWPVDDPFSCIAIGCMRHPAIEACRNGVNGPAAMTGRPDWWKAGETEYAYDEVGFINRDQNPLVGDLPGSDAATDGGLAADELTAFFTA